MKKSVILSAVVCSLSLSVCVVKANDIFIYPNEGQSKERQDMDRYQCHVWAVDQTSFDPSKAGLSVPLLPQSQAKKANPVGGAFKGAALGAAVGAIAGKNVGEAAAIGAGAGILRSGFKNRRSKKKEAEILKAEQSAAAVQIEAGYMSYNRALSACLRGRGYTVG